MSIPEWQHYLEDIEFRYQKRPDLIIEWLKSSPKAQGIPDNIRKARLAKHGYVEPAEPVPQKRKPGRPKKDRIDNDTRT